MKKLIFLLLLLVFIGFYNSLHAQWSGVKTYDGPASMSGINLGIKLSKSQAKELNKGFMELSSDDLKSIFFQGKYEPYVYEEDARKRLTYTPLKSSDLANGTLYFFQINNVEIEGFNGIIKIAKFVFNNKRFGYEVYAFEGSVPGASGVGKLKSSIDILDGKIVVTTSNSLTYPGLFTLDMPPSISGKIPLMHTVITDRKTTYIIESWVISEVSKNEKQNNLFPPNNLEDYLQENGSIDKAIELISKLEYPLEPEVTYNIVSSLYKHQQELRPGKESRFVATVASEDTPLYETPNNANLKELPTGAVVYVIDPDFLRGWYKVNFEGTEAFVKSKDVRYNSAIENKENTPAQTSLSEPVGFSFHPNGSMYVLDAKSREVFIFDDAGKFKEKIAKGKIMGSPLDIEVSDEGNTYILTDEACFIFDGDNNLIKKFGHFLSNLELKSQRSMEISDQSLFILSLRHRQNSSVPGFYVFDLDGNYKRTLGEKFEGTVSIDLGAFDDFDASDKFTLVRGISDGNIYRVGNTVEKIIEPGSKGLATGITVDKEDNSTIYLALSRNGNELAKYDKEGKLVASFGKDILSNALSELKIYRSHLYVADLNNKAIYQFSKNGQLIKSYGADQ